MACMCPAHDSSTHRAAPFVVRFVVSQLACLSVLACCRERCGGQGYLSVNRFGELIGFAHAGMTAEGDNRWAARLPAVLAPLLLQSCGCGA